jgi:hypothetical protein
MVEKLNKLMRLPEKLSCDKRMHFIVGTILMSLLLTFNINIVISFIITIVVAFTIEIYQNITHSGKYEIFDAIAVISGGLFVLLPFIMNINTM